MLEGPVIIAVSHLDLGLLAVLIDFTARNVFNSAVIFHNINGLELVFTSLSRLLVSNQRRMWYFSGRERKSPGFTTEGYMGEVWYQEGPRRIGGKHHRVVPGQSLSPQR